MNLSDEKFVLILVGFEVIETAWWTIKLRVSLNKIEISQ